jgi:AraC family transcriptional regulator
MYDSTSASSVLATPAAASPNPPKCACSVRHANRDDSLSSWRESKESGGASLEQLRIAVAELFDAVSNTLMDEREAAEECIHRARAVLGLVPSPADSIRTPSLALPKVETPKRVRGGLAPWQMRRVTAYIETNLDAKIKTRDLASLVNLSSFYFSRAFKDSFGISPHVYVMRRRLERAQGLMLATNAALAEIAAGCGLADQAHLSKLFVRFVGETPGSWRRARALAPISGGTCSPVATAQI